MKEWKVFFKKRNYKWKRRKNIFFWKKNPCENFSKRTLYYRYGRLWNSKCVGNGVQSPNLNKIRVIIIFNKMLIFTTRDHHNAPTTCVLVHPFLAVLSDFFFLLLINLISKNQWLWFPWNGIIEVNHPNPYLKGKNMTMTA